MLYYFMCIITTETLTGLHKRCRQRWDVTACNIYLITSLKHKSEVAPLGLYLSIYLLRWFILSLHCILEANVALLLHYMYYLTTS